MRTAEFQFVVDCCRAAFDPSFAPPHGLETLDWERFYRLVRFHRVSGLVWAALPRVGGEIPGNVARRICDDAARVASTNRANVAESANLTRAMTDAGIAHLFVKGLPLGTAAYGSPWLKSAVDIDLLVDARNVGEAAKVLRDCDFHRGGGRSQTDSSLKAWHRFRKDSEWEKAGSQSRIDLHSRLTDNPALIPRIGVGSPRQTVAITADLALPTLAHEEMFAHLCVHGASSAWFRLKWITDLAALLRPRTPAEIAALYDRSQDLGAGRASGQALLLADSLYGTLADSPALRTVLRSEPTTKMLWRMAERQLCGRAEPIEPTARPGGTLRIHVTQFLLLPSLAFKASELLRQARAAVG